MADSRKVTVQFLGDDKSLGSTTNSVDGKLGKLGGKFAAFGIAAAAGLAVAVGAAAKGLYDIGSRFDAASDKIRVSTGATGKELEAFNDSLKNVAKSTPSSLEDVGDAIADIGQRLDLTGKPLENITARMLNLSRITETDLGTNIESLSRLFGDWSIKTNDMTGSMDRLFRAAQATGAPVDQLAQSMVQFGGPMRQLGFDFNATAALLGNFQKEGVNTNLVMGSMRIALGKMAREGEPAQETLKRVTEQIANAGSASEANAIALELFGAKAGPDMAAAIREGRFEVGALTRQIAKGGDTIQKASDDTADFGEQWQIIKNRVFVAMEPLATKTFNAVGKGMTRLGPPVQRLANYFEKNLAPALRDFSVWVNTKVVPAAREFVHWFEAKIAPAIKNLAEKRLTALRDGLGDLKAAVKRNEPELRKFGNFLKRAAEITAKYLIPIVAKLSNHQLRQLFAALGVVIDAIGLWVRANETAARGARRLGSAVQAMAGVVRRAVDAFRDFARGAKDAMLGLVNFVGGLGGKITAKASGMWDGIRNGFKSVLNDIIGWWNNLSFSVPGVSVAGKEVWGGVNVSTQNVNYLAEGGIVKAKPGGILANIGEGKYDEAVIPLKPGMNLGGGNVTININGALDPIAVGKQVEQALIRYTRSTGRPLAVRTA